MITVSNLFLSLMMMLINATLTFDFERSIYRCMHDRLQPKGMCSGLHDLFKFWEISDNVSKTVQYRDIVIMED